MAKNNFLSWDTTAIANEDVGGVNIKEGCAPSGINNAIREIMAQLRADIDGGMVYATKAANYTAVANDNNGYLRFTAAATLSLTAVATLGPDWHVLVQAAGGDVVVDPNASETINGATTITIRNGESALIISTGSAFIASNVSVGTSINNAPALTGANLANDDKWGVYDTSAGALASMTTTEVVSGIFKTTRTIDNAQFASASFKLFNAAGTPRSTVFSTTSLTADRTLTVQNKDVTIGVVQGTVVTPSSTSTGYVGIPAGVARFCIHVRDAVINPGGVFIIRVGPSTGVVSSGYVGSACFSLNTGLSVLDLSTLSYIAIDAGSGTTGPISGTLEFNNVPGTNIWVYRGSFGIGTALKHTEVSGSISLAAALDRFTLGTTANTSSFTSGSLWATWEY